MDHDQARERDMSDDQTAAPSGADCLTVRQRQVLDVWLSGATYKELAAQLGISDATVNPHLKAIARKIGASGISRQALKDAAPGRSNASGTTVTP